MLGQWMSKIRRMAGEFQNQFHEAMREAELADLKKEVDDMAAQAANFTNFDPIEDVRKEVESAQRDIEGALAGIGSGILRPPAPRRRRRRPTEPAAPSARRPSRP